MLHSAWVDRIFARLTLRYGAAFLRQWPDAEPDAVKTDWAEVLDGMPGSAIGYALHYLPSLPLTATQFRDICRRAPVEVAPQLEAPKANPAAVRRVLEVIAAAQVAQREADIGQSPAAKALRNVLAICERRGFMTEPQRDFARTCVRMLRADDPIRTALQRYGVTEETTA